MHVTFLYCKNLRNAAKVHALFRRVPTGRYLSSNHLCSVADNRSWRDRFSHNLLYALKFKDAVVQITGSANIPAPSEFLVLVYGDKLIAVLARELGQKPQSSVTYMVKSRHKEHPGEGTSEYKPIFVRHARLTGPRRAGSFQLRGQSLRPSWA